MKHIAVTAKKIDCNNPVTAYCIVCARQIKEALNAIKE
jgi:hypothetical protein